MDSFRIFVLSLCVITFASGAYCLLSNHPLDGYISVLVAASCATLFLWDPSHRKPRVLVAIHTDQNPSPEYQKKAAEAKERLLYLNIALCALFIFITLFCATQLPLYWNARRGEATSVALVITGIAFLLTLPLRSKWRNEKKYSAPLPLVSITETCSSLLNDKTSEVKVTAIYQIPKPEQTDLNKQRISVQFLSAAAKYFERPDCSFQIASLEAYLKTELIPIVHEIGIPVFRINVISIQSPSSPNSQKDIFR